MTGGAGGRPSSLPQPVHDWASSALTALAPDQLSQHCAIFVFDPKRDSLVLAGQLWGAGDDTGDVVPGDWTLPLEGSVCGRVFRTGRPALISDTQLDPDYRAYPGGRSRSEVAVPIAVEDTPVGVLNCESPFPGTFGIVDLERLQATAANVAEAFASAGLGALLG